MSTNETIDGRKVPVMASTSLMDINNSHNEATHFYVGLTLALLSSFFIGSSFILKKKGLLKLGAVGTNSVAGVRAGNFSSICNNIFKNKILYFII